MAIKFSIHMSNRYKLKVTTFQSFIYFRKKVIKKDPLGGGGIRPPPVLIGLKEETFASGKIREIFGRNFREFRELANFGFFARINFRDL